MNTTGQVDEIPLYYKFKPGIVTLPTIPSQMPIFVFEFDCDSMRAWLGAGNQSPVTYEFC